MTDYEKLKSDMERWMRMLGIEPPEGIHDYVPLIMNRVGLDNRWLLRQMEDKKAEIACLKDTLFHSTDRYVRVDVHNYATSRYMFAYDFYDYEPHVGDIIGHETNEYPIVGRRWMDGKLCLLVSNAGVVKACVKPESSKFPIEV